MIVRRPASRFRRGLSLVELLVATVLLALSVAAIVNLWHVSRVITEKNRDWAEYYAIAREETERNKNTTFHNLFVGSPSVFASPNNPQRTDYDASGVPLATNLALNAAPTNGSLYRVVSSFSLVSTAGETLNTRKLGIQQIAIYPRVDEATFDNVPRYQTTIFYAAAGI